MKLDFICPGASKSGTTTLHDVLKIHPDISLPIEKETQFFVNELEYYKGVDFYFKKYFSYDKNRKLIGEICPQYLSSIEVPLRLHNEFGGDLKIIFMFREPISRAYSHYLMKTRTFENLSFDQAINDALTIKNSNELGKKEVLQKHLQFEQINSFKNSKNDLDAYRYSRYIYSGLYATIVNNYLKYFSLKNMHFIIFEEFLQEQNKHMNELFNFLGIEKLSNLTIPKSNSRKIYKNKVLKSIRNVTLIIPDNIKDSFSGFIGSKNYSMVKSKIERFFVNKENATQIAPETMELLTDIYLPEIYNLENILSKNLDLWKNKINSH